MKRLLPLFIALFVCTVSVSAQDTSSANDIVYTTTFYFEKNQGEWIEKSDYPKTATLVECLNSNTESKVEIKGWADPSGDPTYNKTLSLKRARTIYRYLVKKGIDADRIAFEGMGEDSSSDEAEARRSNVIVYITQAAPTPTQPQRPQPQPAPKEDARATEPKEPIDTAMQVEPETIDLITDDPYHRFSLRTNLLYWVGGLMNIGVEWNPANTQLGVVLNGGYSFFGGADWEHALDGWFVSPELRYYLGENDQWFVGGQFLVGGCNVKLSDTGRQGTFMGGGVMGGYKIGLSETFDMDFTLGVGYGTFDYLTYTHSNGVNVYKTKDITKSCIVPIQAGVNLIWKIN